MHVPIEKIYSKTQRDKFRWAIDMATADYHFYNYEGEIVLRNVDETNNDEDDEEQQNSDDEWFLFVWLFFSYFLYDHAS